MLYLIKGILLHVLSPTVLPMLKICGCILLTFIHKCISKGSIISA